MLKIALISKWFIHAERFANYLKTYPECEIAGVWDYDVSRGKEWAKELGCPFLEDYDVLIHSSDVDAVVIMMPVNMRLSYILKAADAGKHIFIEKPLAGSLQEAYTIREAVLRSGIHFIVSDPVKKPSLMAAKEMMDQGLLGTITLVRSRITTEELAAEPYSYWRTHHTGQEMCGGDLIDIGHHSFHILHWLLGKAERVTALYSQVTEFAKKDGTEDNAAALLGYSGGAIGIVEAGSATTGNLYEFEIFGTKGCIQGTKTSLRCCIGDEGWREVPETQWPQAYDYILHEWVRNIVDNRPDERFGIQESLEVLEMIMAAYTAGTRTEPIRYENR